jgi:hypothetical protein
MSHFWLIKAVEAEGLGGGGVVAAALGDVQVAGVLDGRDDGGADGGQVGGPVAGPAGGGVLAERGVPSVLSGCKTDIKGVIAKRAGRPRDKPHRLRLAVLHMLHVHRQQGSEQRRQHAPHMAEMLQKLSVKRSSATSRNSSRTPRELIW